MQGQGTDIPIEARIVAVADCFDAITTNRPYNKASSMEKGIEIILSMKDSAYDPEIVDIFIADINPETDNPDIKERPDGYSNN